MSFSAITGQVWKSIIPTLTTLLSDNYLCYPNGLNSVLRSALLVWGQDRQLVVRKLLIPGFLTYFLQSEVFFSPPCWSILVSTREYFVQQFPFLNLIWFHAFLCVHKAKKCLQSGVFPWRVGWWKYFSACNWSPQGCDEETVEPQVYYPHSFPAHISNTPISRRMMCSFGWRYGDTTPFFHCIAWSCL